MEGELAYRRMPLGVDDSQQPGGEDHGNQRGGKELLNQHDVIFNGTVVELEWVSVVDAQRKKLVQQAGLGAMGVTARAQGMAILV